VLAVVVVVVVVVVVLQLNTAACVSRAKG